MAEPLRILPPTTNADTQKHGRRYAAQDRETAFVTYRAVRSLRETAKRTGVTVSTLHEWSKADGWIARADREDAEDIASARSAIGGQAMPALHRGIARLVKIVEDDASKDQDAIKATELLGKFTGTLAPANAGQPLQPAAAGGRTVSMEELMALDPDQLTAWTPDDWDAGRTG